MTKNVRNSIVHSFLADYLWLAVKLHAGMPRTPGQRLHPPGMSGMSLYLSHCHKDMLYPAHSSGSSHFEFGTSLILTNYLRYKVSEFILAKLIVFYFKSNILHNSGYDDEHSEETIGSIFSLKNTVRISIVYDPIKNGQEHRFLKFTHFN